MKSDFKTYTEKYCLIQEWEDKFMHENMQNFAFQQLECP